MLTLDSFMNMQNSQTVQAWRILAALASDDKYNNNLLEGDWYGLWNYILQDFTQVKDCFVFPQMPIWAAQMFEGASIENQPSTPPPIDQIQLSNSHTPIGSSMSYFATSTPRGPIRSNEDRSFDLVPPDLEYNRSTEFFLSYNSLRSEKNVESFTDDKSYNLFGSTNMSLMPGTHKVPDFSVVHLTYKPNINNPPTFISITGKTVPILVEIKRVSVTRIYNQQEETNYLVDVLKGMTGLYNQAKYLFSTGQQSIVLCIAASGYDWYWTRFINDNGKPVSKPAKKRRPLLKDSSSMVGNWAGRYQIGTQNSNQMFEWIRTWVKIFIDNPNDLEKLCMNDHL